MIRLKSQTQIDGIAAAGAIVAEVLATVRDHAAPGISTGFLDQTAEELIRNHRGASPAFKGLYDFPGTLCTSINFEIVHGVPSLKRRLEYGDLLSVDVGVRLHGVVADAAVTFAVGEVSPDADKLRRTAIRALAAGVEAARPGGRIGDIGAAISAEVMLAGFAVAEGLMGHGVGVEVHEDPRVPNFGVAGRGQLMRPGLVIAIEPMVVEGSGRIRTLDDGWTVATDDGGLSVHQEHTVAVTADGPRILTAAPATVATRES